MNRRTLCVLALGLVAVVAAPPSSSLAQERQGGDRGDFRERRMQELKERLGAKDDEWQVLRPRIEKVNNARFALMAGMFGGRGFGRGGGDRDRGGDRGGDRNGSSSRASESPAAAAVINATRELNTALENKDTPQDQIAAKLTAVREAKAKARAELEAAQKELQEVLQPRQEAVLVANGTLD
jgi:hypothetical protein